MRDAFGGSFMIRIFLIFLLIYILFTAVSLNYAKAFKAKDLVIAYLEDNEIENIGDTMPADIMQGLINYFDKEIIGGLKYTHPVKINCPIENECLKFEDIGIKIEKKTPSDTEKNRKGVYYKVTTYIGYDIGFFRLLKSVNNTDPDNTSDLGVWEISGETRLIVNEK